MSQTICLVDTMLRVNATPRDNTDINSGPTILPWGVPTQVFYSEDLNGVDTPNQ